MNNLNKYNLGVNICLADVPNDYTPFIMGNVIAKMFQTDGVDDKIRFTITSQDTGETIFSGRNAELFQIPEELFFAPIKAIDDCGNDNGMNFYISTKNWTLKNQFKQRL